MVVNLDEWGADWIKVVAELNGVPVELRHASESRTRSELRHPGHSPQSVHAGKHRSTMKAMSEPDGGFTVDGDGKPVTTGWAVALQGSTTHVEASEIATNPAKVRAAIRDKVMTLPDGANAIGGWHDPETGIVHIDHVKVFDKGQHDVAKKFAEDNNQISMANLDAIAAGDWDNAIEETGGTGDARSANLRPHGQGTAPNVQVQQAPARDVRRGAGRSDRQDHGVVGGSGRRLDPHRVDLRHPGKGHVDQDHAGKGRSGIGKIPGGPGLSDDEKHALFRNTRPGEGDGKTVHDSGVMSVEGLDADGNLVQFSDDTEKAIAKRWEELGITEDQMNANLIHAAEVAMGYDRATDTWDLEKLEQGLAESKWYTEQGERLKRLADAEGVPIDNVVAAATVMSAGRLWDGVQNGNYETTERLVDILKSDKPITLSQQEVDFMNRRQERATKSTSKLGLQGEREAGKPVKPSEMSSVELVEVLYTKNTMRGYDSLAQWESDTDGGKKAGKYDVVSEYPLFTSKGTTQVQQAVSILRGDVTPRQAIAGPKYSSFFSNLRRPDLDYSSTNDTWHYRAMAGKNVINSAVKRDVIGSGTIRELTVKDFKKYPKVSTAQDQFQNGASSKSDGLSAGDGMFRDSTQVTRRALDTLATNHPDQFGGMKIHEVQALIWVHYGGGQSSEGVRNGNWDEALSTIPEGGFTGQERWANQYGEGVITPGGAE